MLGSDGSGNPICIDNEGRVLIVDHETGFTEAQMVNSSLVHLVESVGVFEVYFHATKRLAPLPSDVKAWKHALCDAARQLQVARKLLDAEG